MISHFTDAHKEFPRSPTIVYALAWAYGSLYNHERKTFYLKETIKNDPLIIEAYGALGTALYDAEENRTAAIHYLSVFLLLNPAGAAADNARDIRDELLNQEEQ
jgi:hypothetical protein